MHTTSKYNQSVKAERLEQIVRMCRSISLGSVSQSLQPAIVLGSISHRMGRIHTQGLKVGNPIRPHTEPGLLHA